MSDILAKPAPLVVAFVQDLMFTSRIDPVIQHLGYRVRWVGQPADLGDTATAHTPESPGEKLLGGDGLLFDRVTDWHPALLLFDLTNEDIPWRRWMPMLKSAAATRRIPIVCFGPHEDVERMQLAKSFGADAVLARSRFTADMPAILERYGHVPDSAAIDEACDEPLSELARQGIELFNQGQYYKAHDALETAWRDDPGPGRNLYRGVLQVGVAYYQIGRGNYRGAVKMLLRVRQWLEPLSAVCRGVDVAQLRADVERVYQALVTMGPESVAALDPGLLRPIRLVE